MKVVVSEDQVGKIQKILPELEYVQYGVMWIDMTGITTDTMAVLSDSPFDCEAIRVL